MALSAYYRPTTLGELWKLKAEHPEAQFVAGGTDIMVCLREGIQSPNALISFRNIEELRGIEVGASCRIGGATRLADLLASDALGERYPALASAAARVGSAQIRNVATVGGNLCNASPCADLAPPLLVYEATVRLERVNQHGAREARDMPLAEFFVTPRCTRIEPGEVMTAILLDAQPQGARSAFVKKSRVRMDLAQVSVAALVVMDGSRCARVRLAAGAVAPRPLRLRGVEALLEGQEPTPARLAEARALASEEVSPISDIRAGADYRRTVTGVLVERTLRELVGGGQ